MDGRLFGQYGQKCRHSGVRRVVFLHNTSEQEEANDKMAYNSNNQLVSSIGIPANASMVAADVRGKIDSLISSIKFLHENPENMSFWMSVDVNTAKAALVPIPTYDNMLKLKKNYDSLPKRVKNTMKNNMSENDFQSFQTIIAALTEHATLGIEEQIDVTDDESFQQPSDVESADDASTSYNEEGEE